MRSRSTRAYCKIKLIFLYTMNSYSKRQLIAKLRFMVFGKLLTNYMNLWPMNQYYLLLKGIVNNNIIRSYYVDKLISRHWTMWFYKKKELKKNWNNMILIMHIGSKWSRFRSCTNLIVLLTIVSKGKRYLGILYSWPQNHNSNIMLL